MGSQYSRTMSALLLPLLVCVTPLVSGQLTNCEVGWLDGGTTLGCLLLDNNAMTWVEAVMYCSTLSKIESSDGASVRQFLSIHAMYAGGRDWWVSGNDLGTENSWKWLAGSDVSLDLFLQGVAAPIGTDYNCML